MSDLIRIKGGSGDVPELQDRELAYRKDTKTLYIGTEDGAVQLCIGDATDAIIAEISELQATIAEIGDAITLFTAEIEDITARLEVLEKPSE